jgi:hypothetical protein
MGALFIKRLLFAVVLLNVSLLCFCLAPREWTNKPWYKPRWMRRGALYGIAVITLIGGLGLAITAIMEGFGD